MFLNAFFLAKKTTTKKAINSISLCHLFSDQLRGLSLLGPEMVTTWGHGGLQRCRGRGLGSEPRLSPPGAGGRRGRDSPQLRLVPIRVLGQVISLISP